MGWKVLVTARAFWTSGSNANERLLAEGCEVVRSSRAGPLPEAELLPQLKDCDAVISSNDPYHAPVFAACPNLKVVSRWGVGIDSVNLEDATAAGVVATNTPGAMADAVADYTLGLMLAVSRKIVEGDAMMRSGGWGELPGPLVFGKVLGLVGTGAIGQAVARRAAGFGMRILGYDPPMQAAIEAGQMPVPTPAIEFMSLEALLGASDFVCVHAPSMPETRGMFNASRFAQMKPTAYFINTARGALVNQPDLLAALEKGHIAGAGIDVYVDEPVPADDPIRKAPRSVLTPHSAFNAYESAIAMSEMSVDNVLSVMHGKRPAGICNPLVWDSTVRRSKNSVG